MNGRCSDRERGQAVAGTGRGDERAGLDGGMGEVLTRVAVGVEDAGTEQRSGGLRAPGVPDDGDAIVVDARWAGR